MATSTDKFYEDLATWAEKGVAPQTKEEQDVLAVHARAVELLYSPTAGQRTVGAVRQQLIAEFGEELVSKAAKSLQVP